MPDSGSTEAGTHAAHFESIERQAEATRLGMWVFLGSEALLFSGLFALYAGYRAHWPQAFDLGVHHNDIVIGSVNTMILIVSSGFAALSVQALETGGRRLAQIALAITIVLGLLFLSLKGWEYTMHVHHGIVPGGGTAWFQERGLKGLSVFFTLYYLTTGLHALHVLIGCTVLGVFLWLLSTGRLKSVHSHRLEAGVLYWHLVDAIWIFVWPLYYLMGGHG